MRTLFHSANTIVQVIRRSTLGEIAPSHLIRSGETAKTLRFMAEAVRNGKLVIPISRKLPLSKAADAHAASEKGGIGKVLLLV